MVADSRDSRRKTDLAQIKIAIETWRSNGGKINTCVINRIRCDNNTDPEDWQVPALLPVSDPNGGTNSLDDDSWTSLDSKGNKPSAYLPGGNYPLDPLNTPSNSRWYKILIEKSKDVGYTDTDPNPPDYSVTATGEFSYILEACFDKYTPIFPPSCTLSQSIQISSN